MYLSMKKKAKRLTQGLVGIWLALSVAPWLAFPAEARGENRLKDLHVEDQGNRTRMAFLMDRRPSLLINDVVQSGRVSIRLPDASTTPLEATRMSASMGNVSFVGVDGASGVTVSVPLENGFQKMVAGWLEEKSLLVVDLFPHKNGSLIRRPADAKGMRHLKGIRSGPRKDCTRVVLDLDARPTFKVDWKDPVVMVLSLFQTETAFKVERVGTLKHLKGALLTRGEDTLSLSLHFENAPLAWRVFWLDEGNRLVVDLFESTHETPFESVALPSGPGNEGIEETGPPSSMPPSPVASLGEAPAQPPDRRSDRRLSPQTPQRKRPSRNRSIPLVSTHQGIALSECPYREGKDRWPTLLRRRGRRP